MVVRKNIIDLALQKNRLLTEIDTKISAGLLSKLNDKFSTNHYPIIVDRDEVERLLNGIDFRIRKMPDDSV